LQQPLSTASLHASQGVAVVKGPQGPVLIPQAQCPVLRQFKGHVIPPVVQLASQR
jgi:hypothetical protein